MNARRASLALLLAVFVAACGDTLRYTPLAVPSRPMPPRTPQSVDVFTRFSLPTRQFIAVGLIETGPSMFGGSNDPGYYLERVRETAATRGCDAVIVDMNGTTMPQAYYGARPAAVRRGFTGTCIVYP